MEGDAYYYPAQHNYILNDHHSAKTDLQKALEIDKNKYLTMPRNDIILRNLLNNNN